MMTVWMNHGKPEKVEALFQECKEGYEAGNTALEIRPELYSTRLHAWAKAGHPEETIGALNEWISACENKVYNEMPETREFNAVLRAWSNSEKPSNAAKEAEDALRQMM